MAVISRYNLWIVGPKFDGVISSPNAAQLAQIFSRVSDFIQGPDATDYFAVVPQSRRLLLAVNQV
jgi:hypothetical protein